MEHPVKQNKGIKLSNAPYILVPLDRMNEPPNADIIKAELSSND